MKCSWSAPIIAKMQCDLDYLDIVLIMLLSQSERLLPFIKVPDDRDLKLNCRKMVASFPGLPLSRTAREEEKKKKKLIFLLLLLFLPCGT